MRVIVVDDEKPCLDEMVYLLSEQKGMDIVGAYTNPADALETLTELQPDAAFVDLLMPRLNGVELAAHMHALRPALKIMFVTAYAKEIAKIGLKQAAGSLLKPVSRAKLQELLLHLPD